VGDGRAVYLAGVGDETALHDLYLQVAGRAGLELLVLPHDVEAAALAGKSSDLLLLFNHSDEERTVDVGNGEWRARIGSVSGGRVVLEPRGLAFLDAERAPQPATPLADTLP
jgi:Beta-galactosidase C-terminal domain